MSQDYYQYIYHIHQKQLEIDQINASVKGKSPNNSTLRKRVRLSLSDALLGLGQRIRPAEFQVTVQGGQAQEGALEANAEGC